MIRWRISKFLTILPFLFVSKVTTPIDADFHVPLPEVEILEYVKVYSNIQQADSIVAPAMLLNRECPTCSYEEKVYWASCITYGVKRGYWTWKQIMFQKRQYWGFKDKRLRFNPKNKNHQENLKAVKEAWKNPKPVLFYASEKDTANNSIHFKQVKRNAVWKGKGHYYSLYLK